MLRKKRTNKRSIADVWDAVSYSSIDKLLITLNTWSLLLQKRSEYKIMNFNWFLITFCEIDHCNTFSNIKALNLWSFKMIIVCFVVLFSVRATTHLGSFFQFGKFLPLQEVILLIWNFNFFFRLVDTII